MSDSYATSSRLFERAQKSIAAGVNSGIRKMEQPVPLYFDHGSGSRLYDVDGNEYLDYNMAIGPISLGYGYEPVDAAIRNQLEDGIVFPLIHPLEVEIAELVREVIPNAESVRYAKAGAEVTSAAVRVSRAYTGRDKVLCCGYHGWHDWYIGSTTRDAGVPKAVVDLTATFTFGDLGSLERALETYPDAVAAVVLEPSGATVPEPGYLEAVVDLTRRHGAVSVFDEVITGFRLAPGGARERYGVEPDLSCYGKALGNGMPVSAVAGRAAVMGVFEEIFFSGTHGGEALSLAAAAAVLDTIADGRVLAGIEDRGRRLQTGLAERVADHGLGDLVTVDGEPQRTVVGFAGPAPLVTKSWVQQCFAEAGILFNGSFFISARHTDADVDRTVAAFDDALAVLASGDDVAARLVGPPVEPVFRPV